MKKLLLTSYGFPTAQLKSVAQTMIADCKATKACIISTSWPKEKETHPQMQQIKNELLNFNLEKVEFLDVEFDDVSKLYNYDLIFLNGGYPFYLLHFLKLSGAFTILQKMAQNGSLIFGLSAGSIVMGPTLNLMQHLYPEDNQYNDTDLTGLNLTNIQIYPHFKEMLTRDPDIQKKICLYESSFDTNVVRLNNSQAIQLVDNRRIFVG